MCQPGRPSPHGEGQWVSSPGLFAFQSAKSRGSSLRGFGSCSSTWSGRWPDSRPYSGKLRDAEVDVALDRVGEAALDELLDERDDLRDVLGHLRQVVGHPEPEVADVLEVPGGRALGELGARARRGLVDLVVDVGDVVDERRRRSRSRAARSAATCRSRTAARCRCGRARRRSGRRSTSGSGPGGGGSSTSELRRRCQRAASILRSVSSRGSAAITAHSSGPLSRPVSARRTARRWPPTAFSSRTIAFAPVLVEAARPRRHGARGSARASRAPRAATRPVARGSSARARAPRSGRARRAAPARPRRGTAEPGGELVVGQLRDHLDRERADPRQVEMDVVAAGCPSSSR